MKLFRSLAFSLALGFLTLILIITIPISARSSTPQMQTVAVINDRNPIDRGLNAYEAGQYAEAIATWQQVEQTYQPQDTSPARVSNLNYLALGYHKLGDWDKAEQYISLSLELLQQSSQPELLLAQALNTKGSLELATGKSQAALATWEQAATTYEQAGDEVGVIGSQINQAQALQSLGFHRRSQKLLEQSQQQLTQQPDPLLKTKLLRSLGTTLQTIGSFDRAEEVLQESLAIAEQLDLPEERAATYFSLGNNAKLKEEHQTTYYQQAATLTTQPILKIEARLNLLSSLNTTDFDALSQIQADIANLPPSRPKIYAQVNLAKIAIADNNSQIEANRIQIPDLLQKSLVEARNLADSRAESLVLGTLGHFHERQQQWLTAHKYTQQALNIAQALDAPDLNYQWQWQLGRIQENTGNTKSAIASYTEAVDNLQNLRKSLAVVDSEAQFSFRESVEPVYRELVRLLLDNNPSQNQLQQARSAIESLQVAELENFFREACLDVRPKQIEEVDATAAVVYPIILPDRLAVILSLPDRSLKYYSTAIASSEIENTVENLYQSLNPIFSNRRRMQLSQVVYDWLLKPTEADLERAGIKTLTFVLDGSLRKIPMAALYDGRQYAIEKYNIALTPGLQLLPSQGLRREELEAVVAGISESNQGFASLPGVKEEVTQISAQLSSRLLLNEEFTNSNLQQQLQETAAPIVHLATHGQFGSTPESTFIVTWNNRIGVNELEDLLRDRQVRATQPIELMILSACETATGDDRAVLGMAGMAVRSGAIGTLATLWSVKDESTTQLIDEFYHQLADSSGNINKAEALRKAQLALLNSPDFNHPFYWSPFVLVGNWL